MVTEPPEWFTACSLLHFWGGFSNMALGRSMSIRPDLERRTSKLNLFMVFICRNCDPEGQGFPYRGCKRLSPFEWLYRSLDDLAPASCDDIFLDKVWKLTFWNRKYAMVTLYQWTRILDSSTSKHQKSPVQGSPDQSLTLLLIRCLLKNCAKLDEIVKGFPPRKSRWSLVSTTFELTA